MQFPSLSNLINGSFFVLKRFPFCMAIAFIGTGAAYYLTYIDYKESELEKNVLYLIMTCAIGLPLSFSLAVYAERKLFSLQKNLLLNASAFVLLAAYYISLRVLYNNAEIVRFVLFNIAVHLLVAFAPFLQKNEINGFWQFNKSLFLRLFFSGIYSFTLYLGIVLALLAIDNLFGIKIEGKYYMRLWLLVTGIFNTWFFLAGVPKDLNQIEYNNDYPKGLKIFTQYVLLPLITLYLIILYCYLGKIIITQNLPKGWVSYLVIGFSVSGILALLLIHPIRNLEGNKWIKIFSKWFYAALYPLLIMLFVAIGTRISDYGITENRYFIIVIALWLMLMATYFIFSKKANIKYIPVSLCLLAMLTSFGPWGAFSVSEKSQLRVLQTTLEQNAILIDGKITSKHNQVTDSVAVQITSIVKYFNDMHGFEKMKPWFSQPIDTLLADSNKYSRVSEILKLMNVPEKYYQHYPSVTAEGYEYFSCYSDNKPEATSISGYDYEMPFYAYSNYNDHYYSKINLNSDTLIFGISKDSSVFEIKRNGILIYNMLFNEFMASVKDSLPNSGPEFGNSITCSRKQMQRVHEDSLCKIKIQFTGMYGSSKKTRYKIDNASGTCYIKLKK